MKMEELEKYCINEGIKHTDLAIREASEYSRGLATAFMWIAACIQKDEVPEIPNDK